MKNEYLIIKYYMRPIFKNIESENLNAKIFIKKRFY